MVGAILLLLTGTGVGLGQEAKLAAPPGPLWGVHDPSMVKAGATWYLFSSGGRPDGPQLPIHCSSDLKVWTRCGHVFREIPPWIRERLPGVRDLWAPEISFEGGEYRVYYAYSLLGRNTSGIALVTNKTLDPNSPDFAWVDRGIVLESKASDDYNAIDPNFVRDAQGQDWLDFGSFWSGVKLRRLGPDGLPSAEDKHLYSLARRAKPGLGFMLSYHIPGDWEAIEGPFLVERGGYYYLFTSWDHCCRGADSNYRVVVGRAKSITGPYFDEDGKKLEKGGGTTILAGNASWAGPGGESVWMGPGDDDAMIYHAYDRATGRVALRVSPIQWVADWPRVEMQP